MAAYGITVYSRVYLPMEEGDDEPTLIKESSESWSTEDFDSVRDDLGDWFGDAWVSCSPVPTAVAMIRSGKQTNFYASGYSSGPGWSPNGWYLMEDYVHPYTQTREERTLHLTGFSEIQQRVIYRLALRKS